MDLSPVTSAPQEDSTPKGHDLQKEVDELRALLSKEQSYSRSLEEGINELCKELHSTQHKLRRERYWARKRRNRAAEGGYPRGSRGGPPGARRDQEYYRQEFRHSRPWTGRRHDSNASDPAPKERPSHRRPPHRRPPHNRRPSHTTSHESGWRHGH